MTQTSFTLFIITTIIFQYVFLVRVTVGPLLLRFARLEVRLFNPKLSEVLLHSRLYSFSSGAYLVLYSKW